MFKFHQKLKSINSKKGFLLVELIVSVFVFGIVMTMSIGSLVLALDANKKAQSLKSVLNNLTVVLETMTKTLSTGKYYYCDNRYIAQLPYTRVRDCNGEITIGFLSGEDLGTDGVLNDVIEYQFISPYMFNGVLTNGYIQRRLFIDGNFGNPIGPVRMTAPEVNITDMKFYVTGTDPDDQKQPKVLIVINGEAPAGPRGVPTAFTLQTLVSQLNPDF